MSRWDRGTHELAEAIVPLRKAGAHRTAKIRDNGLPHLREETSRIQIGNILRFLLEDKGRVRAFTNYQFIRVQYVEHAVLLEQRVSGIEEHHRRSHDLMPRMRGATVRATRQ